MEELNPQAAKASSMFSSTYEWLLRVFNIPVIVVVNPAHCTELNRSTKRFSFANNQRPRVPQVPCKLPPIYFWIKINFCQSLRHQAFRCVHIGTAPLKYDITWWYLCCNECSCSKLQVVYDNCMLQFAYILGTTSVTTQAHRSWNQMNRDSWLC